MIIADCGGHLGLVQRAHPHGLQYGDEAVQHAEVDVLADPGQVAFLERGERADGPVQAGDQIPEADPDPRALTAGPPRDRHQPAHRLRDEIIRGCLTEGSLLAKTTDGHCHKFRVDLPERGDGEPESLEHPRPEVLDEDVAAPHEFDKGVTLLHLLQIQRDAHL